MKFAPGKWEPKNFDFGFLSVIHRVFWRESRWSYERKVHHKQKRSRCNTAHSAQTKSLYLPGRHGPGVDQKFLHFGFLSVIHRVVYRVRKNLIKIWHS